MIAEYRAIKTALQAALGGKVAVVIGDATGHAMPFVSIWGPPGSRTSELSVAGGCGIIDAQIGITCTAETADAALQMSSRTQETLTPGLDPAVLPGVPGRYVTLSHFESRPVQIDRQIALPKPGTHPAYVVILYDLTSQPTGD